MSDFLFEALTTAQINDAVIRGKIAAAIYNKRVQLKMTQKEFANHLNVTQGMVSKWENPNYSFTITSLVELMDKLDIPFNVYINDTPAIKKQSRTLPYILQSDSLWKFSGTEKVNKDTEVA